MSDPNSPTPGYLVLIRGINVGGRNKVPMAALRNVLREGGFDNVSTYIASGNVILRSRLPAPEIKSRIEDALPTAFALDDPAVQVLVVSGDQLQSVIDNKPAGFGEHPELYHSDAIFLIGIEATEAMTVFDPRAGVDIVWPGDGVVYSQRLSAERTRSRLSKIIGTPLYRSMTIRSWSTTMKLWELMQDTRPS